MLHELNLDLISRARTFLEGKIRCTPIDFSPCLTDLLGAPIYFKMEHLQITGSFKLRGALFYLSTLSPEERAHGVATCSAGNHGLGVAYAAKEYGVDCTVYVPKGVDRAKQEKIVLLGARVIQSEFVGYDETLLWAEEEVLKSGQHFITPFEDERIMAANGGTIAAEILEAIPDVQNVIFPVGGGGLGAGISFYFKETQPSVRMIGCQHVGSPALKLSLEKGEAVTTLPPLETIAGGIEGGIGKRCFVILKDRIDDVCLVSEEEIGEACLWMLQHHQFLIEPSAVVTVASCLSGQLQLKGKTVVLLSGRNVAYSTLQGLVAMPRNNFA